MRWTDRYAGTNSTIEGDAAKIDDAIKIINEVAEAINGTVVGFESYELVAQSW